MPAAAVTIAGWLSVRSGSTTAEVGRSRGWLMPVFTCCGEDVEDADRGALAAGPGRGGHGDQRQQRLGRRSAAADRRVDVVEQLAGVGGEQVDRLGGVDRRPAADRDDRVERAGVARRRRSRRRNDSSVGSTRASSYVVTASPWSLIWSAIRPGCPVAATPASVTSSTRRAPVAARS